jgi:hypothetical protein
MSENQISGEDNLLEKLALRLLIYPGDTRVNQPRLFLGQIPANLPLEIPVPECGLPASLSSLFFR